MTKDIINEYFQKKGIIVSYDTLNSSEDLINSYISEFHDIVNSSKACKSQDVKFSCYNKLYNFKARPKFTGFENIKKIDREFRRHISPLVNKSQFSPTLIVDTENIKNINISFKDALKKKVTSFNNPIVYLSGGLDSELVAKAMLDSEVKFTTVIFEFVDNQQKIVNSHDTHYAYEFCKEHSLIPLVKTINVEELWKSKDFAEFALELQIVSPHLVTHAYMVTLMNINFPNSTHVFGGEVRFYSNHLLDDGRMANLVLLAKTAPGYTSYFASSFTGPQAASLDLTYSNDGTWDVSGTGNQTFDTDSGTWTTTPGSTYQYRIVTRNIITDQGNTNYVPSSALPTAWSTIGASTTVCLGTANPTSPAAVLEITFGIEVRTASGAQQGVVQSSSINFNLEYNA